MRIAIVASPLVPVPPPMYGGTEQVIFNLINGLLELGHEVTLLASADSKVDCKLIPIVDRAIYFPKSSKGLKAHSQKLDVVNKRIETKLRRLLPKVDIIHSHGFDLKKFQKFPNVTTLHGPFGFIDIDYYAEHKDLNFVSISMNQRHAYPKLHYTANIYNGEDPLEFPIVKDPEEYLCFLGRFDRDKNPHLAILLAIGLGMKLKMAGKLDYLGDGYFETEVQPYFDHPLIEYLGEVGFDQKIDLISKASCNLHPTSFREPFGLTVLEAAYCGTPTLAINRGAMSELIQHGKTGILAEDFIEGLHLINKCFKMDRSYIAKRARRMFNYQKMAKQYVAAYQKVIDRYALAE